jgi:hypothetical protein
MAIDADYVRELAARMESAQLGFRLTMPANDAELARDLSALANGLPPGSEPGYLLVGVAADDRSGTGLLDGVDLKSVKSNDEYHRQVGPLLNHVPRFEFYTVDVGGDFIGVFEVFPSGRPSYSLSNTPPLQRRAAFYRAGKMVDIATPLQIVEWARVDGRLANEVALLAADYLRSQVMVAPHVVLPGEFVHREGESLDVSFTIQNLGQVPFSVEVSGDWDYTEELRATDRSSMTFMALWDDDRHPVTVSGVDAPSGVLAPRESARVRLRCPFDAPQAAVARVAAQRHWQLPLIDVRVNVTCRAPTTSQVDQRTATLIWRVTP